MDKRRIGTHQTHCCLRHGCKYGDEDCPVVTGGVEQSYVCETCSNTGVKSVSEIKRRMKLEQPGSIKIELAAKPDEEMSKQGTPYSWCILAYNEDWDPWDQTEWKVVASGWSSTPQQAYFDAIEAMKR